MGLDAVGEGEHGEDVGDSQHHSLRFRFPAQPEGSPGDDHQKARRDDDL